MSFPETVCVGIDGAHFELIRPWLNDGTLPNIRRVVEGGVSSDLIAVLPPVTSPNWKAYATGKNPGKLGIFWWENIDTDSQRVYYPSERKQYHPEFWELLSEHMPVGVIGLPTTYPPKVIDGFYVSGPPDSEKKGFAYPEEIETLLRREFDYRISPTHSWQLDQEATSREVLELIKMRFRAALRLLEEYDVSFLQVTTFYINSLHHFRWNDSFTRRAWKIVDKYVGTFLEECRNVLLMSDHGSNEIDTAFYVNTWLEHQGYLTLDTTIADTLHRVGVTSDRLLGITKSLGITELAKRATPRAVRNHIPNARGELKRASKTDNIDWDRTVALASGQGPVYLTMDTTNPRYDEVRTELAEQLCQVHTPAGNPVAEDVLFGEAVYSGEFEHEAPDLVIDQASGIHIPGRIGRDEVFADPGTDGWIAENKRQGLFAAKGADFANDKIDPLSILDLAPTLLHLYDCRIPSDMDGRVRQSLYAPNAEVRDRDPDYYELSSSEVSERRIGDRALHDRLADLGYLE